MRTVILHRIDRRIYVLVHIFLFAVCLIVTGLELRRLQTEMLIQRIELAGINYDSFREMRLEGEALISIDKKLSRLIKKNPELKTCTYIDPVGYLTFSMMAGGYNLINSNIPDSRTFLRGVSRIADNRSFIELYGYYKAIWSDLECFPIPRVQEGSPDITYADTWYVLRSYGGNRRHEGTDLMASNNVRGYFPVISITDGVVENIGWLEQGGYRIGIRSGADGYFYYAHLDSYAPGLKDGDTVIAGQLIGYMGDTGYGSEGTLGQFDVHLHLGIYVRTATGEMSINPYYILKILEEVR